MRRLALRLLGPLRSRRRGSVRYGTDAPEEVQETVYAVLENVETGEKRIISQKGEEDEVPKL